MYKKIKEGGIYWYKGNDEDRHDTSKYYLVMSSDDSEISVFAVPLHKKIRRRYLKEGMIFTGKVRNVIDFGAFVDIGVHQDGLVHISQISDDYIKHPSEVLKVGQTVEVKILSIDLAKKRISLTMKGIEKKED